MGKTSQQNLVRHKPGRYYARTFGNNKEIWKSLRTTHFSVAKAWLAEFLREQREKQVATANQSSAKMTFAEALAIHDFDRETWPKRVVTPERVQLICGLLASGESKHNFRKIILLPSHSGWLFLSASNKQACELG